MNSEKVTLTQYGIITLPCYSRLNTAELKKGYTNLICQYGGPQCCTLWQILDLFLLAHACEFDANQGPCLCFSKTSFPVTCMRNVAKTSPICLPCISFGVAGLSEKKTNTTVNPTCLRGLAIRSVKFHTPPSDFHMMFTATAATSCAFRSRCYQPAECQREARCRGHCCHRCFIVVTVVRRRHTPSAWQRSKLMTGLISSPF